MPKPKTYILTVANDGLLESPVWEDSFRGSNWLAVVDVDPSAPGGLSRRFLPKGRGECMYNVESLALFDAVEFAADYTQTSGKKLRHRWYGVVVAKTDVQILVEEAISGARAAIRAKEARTSTADKLRALKTELDATEKKSEAIRQEIASISSSG